MATLTAQFFKNFFKLVEIYGTLHYLNGPFANPTKNRNSATFWPEPDL